MNYLVRKWMGGQVTDKSPPGGGGTCTNPGAPTDGDPHQPETSQPPSDRHRVPWPLVAPAALVATGLALRLIALGRSSLWYDEAFSWHLCRLPLSRMLAKIASDVHPPLFYAALRAWIVLFGDSVVAMRILSALAGSGCVAAAYWLGSVAARPGGPGRAHGAGLCAAALVASNGFLIYYSQQARMYSLALLLTFCATAFLIEALRESSRRATWAGHSATLSGLILTHYYGLLLAASHAAIAAIALIYNRGRGRVGATSSGFGSSALLTVLIVSFAMPTFVGQLRQVERTYWTEPWRASMVLDGFVNFATGRVERVGRNLLEPAYSESAHVAALVVLAALLAFVIVGAGRNSIPLLLCPLGSIGLLAAASAWGRNIWVAHSVQIFWAFLPIATAVAIWLSKADLRTRVALSAAAVALSTVGCIYEATWVAREKPPGIRRAAEELNRMRRPGDLVVLNPSRIHYSFLYYLADRRAVAVGPPWEVYHGVWNDDLAHRYILAEPEARASAADLIATSTARVWLVEGTYMKVPGFMPPNQWTLVEDRRYRDWFPPDVRIRLYLTHSKPASADIAPTVGRDL